STAACWFAEYAPVAARPITTSMITSPANTCSPWNPVIAKNADPYALVPMWNETVIHSWAWNPRNAAPIRKVNHTHRLNEDTLPCLMRWAAICMVPLDATRIDVDSRRSASTLMSGGVHAVFCARNV